MNIRFNKFLPTGHQPPKPPKNDQRNTTSQENPNNNSQESNGDSFQDLSSSIDRNPPYKAVSYLPTSQSTNSTTSPYVGTSYLPKQQTPQPSSPPEKPLQTTTNKPLPTAQKIEPWDKPKQPTPSPTPAQPISSPKPTSVPTPTFKGFSIPQAGNYGVGDLVYQSENTSAPKTVIVLDDFVNKTERVAADAELLSHGQLVTAALQERIQAKDLGDKIKVTAINIASKGKEMTPLQDIVRSLDEVARQAAQLPRGSVYLNMSFGLSIQYSSFNKVMASRLPSGIIPLTPSKLADQNFVKQWGPRILQELETFSKITRDTLFIQMLDRLKRLNELGVKIYLASGNSSNTSFDPAGLLPFVEVVGATDSSGRVASYSDVAFVEPDDLNAGDIRPRPVSGGYDINGDGVADLKGGLQSGAVFSPVRGTSFASPREVVDDIADSFKG